MTRWLFLTLIFSTSIMGNAQDNLQRSMDKLEKFKFRDRDSLEFYCTEVLKLSTPSNLYEKGQAYQYLGNIQYYKYSNYDSTFALYDIAIRYYEELNDSTHLAHLYNNYGVIQRTKGDYKSALNYFSKALDFYTLTDSATVFATRLLTNISNLNFSIGNYAES